MNEYSILTLRNYRSSWNGLLNPPAGGGQGLIKLPDEKDCSCFDGAVPAAFLQEREIRRGGNVRLCPDTVCYVSPGDSDMREQPYRFADGMERERAKADSLKQAEMASYPEFQRDSVNFRKITKIINGGYNGWDDWYKLWLNAGRFFKLYVPSR